MKKSDLKTGMWIETVDGDLGMVLLNVDGSDNYISYVNDGGYDFLSGWTEDLLCEIDGERLEESDIIKIYDYDSSLSIPGELLWEREKESKKPINLTINVTINNKEDIKNIEKHIQDVIKKCGICI